MQGLLSQLRSLVAGNPSVAGGSAATIARNSQEVLEGIESALTNMQQQSNVSGQRLQRVGESAAETVGLLKELVAYAEQIGILSVNAAIQATLAGDAGNGFAVIADQLQRIAARFETICFRVETLSDMVSNDVSEAILDTKERAAELSRSKRLTGDLRTALAGLARGDDDAPVATPGVEAMLDELSERLSAITSEDPDAGSA